jgi:pimeloyl-ACP methyl ester carboxylesterase
VTTTQQHVARTSGGEIAFVDEGEGPAVLLLPGFPASSRLWNEFVPVLATRFRVIAADLLGTGASEKPAEVPLHLTAQAAYLREVLGDLEIDRFAVVGHGIGGAVAQALAIGEGVGAMVLMDAVGPDEPTRAVKIYAEMPARLRTPEFVRGAIATAFDRGMAFRERLSPDLLESFEDAFAGAEGAAAFFRFMGQTEPAKVLPTPDELGALEIPVLIFWGEEDPWWPVSLGERLNEAMPTSSFATLPGCSHFLPLDAADTLAPFLLEWLRVRYAGETGHTHEAADYGPIAISIGRRPVEPQPAGFEDLAVSDGPEDR